MATVPRLFQHLPRRSDPSTPRALADTGHEARPNSKGVGGVQEHRGQEGEEVESAHPS